MNFLTLDFILSVYFIFIHILGSYSTSVSIKHAFLIDLDA